MTDPPPCPEHVPPGRGVPPTCVSGDKTQDGVRSLKQGSESVGGVHAANTASGFSLKPAASLNLRLGQAEPLHVPGGPLGARDRSRSQQTSHDHRVPFLGCRRGAHL